MPKDTVRTVSIAHLTFMRPPGGTFSVSEHNQSPLSYVLQPHVWTTLSFPFLLSRPVSFPPLLPLPLPPTP
jgi:hypothetical protein